MSILISKDEAEEKGYEWAEKFLAEGIKKCLVVDINAFRRFDYPLSEKINLTVSVVYSPNTSVFAATATCLVDGKEYAVGLNSQMKRDHYCYCLDDLGNMGEAMQFTIVKLALENLFKAVD